MATNRRTQKFMSAAIKRMFRLHRAAQSPDPNERLLEECRLSQEWIKSSLLPYERELQDLCYFEYAFMSPYQRDELFLRTYNQVVKQLWPTYHVMTDTTTDELKHDRLPAVYELNTPENKSAIRHARQHFDAYGMQYVAAMKAIIRAGIQYRGSHGIPMPNQLYSHLAIELLDDEGDYIRDRFEAPFADNRGDERFLANAYVGHPMQVRALDAIQKQVKEGLNRPKVLAGYLSSGHISEGEARMRFGDPMVDAAFADHGPALFEGNGGESLLRMDRPACMGYSYDPNAPTCAICPVHAECADFTMAVRERQIAVTGSDRPAAKRVREGAAERKRLERHRKKPAVKAEVEAMRLALEKLMGIKIPGLKKRSRK